MAERARRGEARRGVASVATMTSSSKPRRSLGLLGLALLALLAGAVAGDEERGEASGLGALLRRLMLDLFEWLGHVFGLRGAGDEEHAGRGRRFPPRAGQRSDPHQDVEHIPAVSGRGAPEDLDRPSVAAASAPVPVTSSSAEVFGNGDASVEQLDRPGEGGGLGDGNDAHEGHGGGRGGGGGPHDTAAAASREEMAGERRDLPLPSRVMA